MIAGTQAEYQSDAGSTKDTLNGRAMGCFFVNIFEKIERIISAVQGITSY